MTATSIPASQVIAEVATAAPVATKRKAGVYRLLDAARGFACLWVVAHHALGFLVEREPSLSQRAVYSFFLNGALGVWIFFVISGYCIANTAASSLRTNKRGWVYARARRIFPPCWYSVGLCAASALAAQYAVHIGFLRSSTLASVDLLHRTPLFYLANLTLTQELFHQRPLSGVYWTLCYEVGFYSFVAVALGAARYFRLGSRGMLNVLHLLTIATLSLDLVAHVPYPFDLWPHFGLGVLVYDVLSHGWRRGTVATAALVISGVAMFVALHPSRHGYVDRGGPVALLTSTICAVLLLSLYRFDERLSAFHATRFFAWVGVFSYSLYLTHITLIDYVHTAAKMTHVLPNALPIYLVLVFIICIAFAWCFFRWCEQPFMSNHGRRHAAEVLLAAIKPTIEPAA